MAGRLAAAHNPKAPSTWTHARVVRQVTDLANRVDGSGVDIAHLSTDDRRCPVLLQDLPHAVNASDPGHLDLDDRGSTHAEEAQCPVDRAVTALARNDRSRGAPNRPASSTSHPARRSIS